MRTVEIPEPLYERAVRAAEEQGLTLEELVIEALVAGFIDEEYAPLTPEQVERIAEAEADLAAGRVYTPEQVREHFARRKAERVGRAA